MPRELVRTLYTPRLIQTVDDRAGLLFGYETLLTGVRLALLASLAGARDLALFGFDFFRSEPGQLWHGHDLPTDHAVLAYVRQSIQAVGGVFYWHEQAMAARGAALEQERGRDGPGLDGEREAGVTAPV
jgi:hypothetical protein